MKRYNLELMSTDELWALHQSIAGVLTAKITAEKRELEKRLEQLGRRSPGRSIDLKGSGIRERRPYPRVLPKFRNPMEPSETWSGRGKKPRWLTAQLKSGGRIDDFRIGQGGGKSRQGR
jgi:DNA-binding protein H-NS